MLEGALRDGPHRLRGGRDAEHVGDLPYPPEVLDLIMRTAEHPRIRRLASGQLLTEPSDESDELVLVLNGVVAEFGPGAILGERSVLEAGRRTSTVRAVTKVTVAVCPADAVDRAALERLRIGHRREDS